MRRSAAPSFVRRRFDCRRLDKAHLSPSQITPHYYRGVLLLPFRAYFNRVAEHAAEHWRRCKNTHIMLISHG
jgi:hypothetical protein